jgi:endonuclease/exonuclease/phosphatase family metal-dependent hydrolase
MGRNFHETGGLAVGEVLRIATYNVEWFNALFDDRGRLLRDKEPSERFGITREDQIAALGTVFTALDADAVMIIEAPDTQGKRSTVTALERFAAKFNLRARKAIIGYPSDTEQEIALLFDPTKLGVQHDPKGNPIDKRGQAEAPRFDGVYHADLDSDGASDTIRFSKPPLELAVTTALGKTLRLIGVHAKSKAPHGAHSDADRTRISIENRRKQLVECIWLRQRVAAHLAAHDPLIVLGDFNDGPGIDEYEKLLGKSGVEVVMGTDSPPELRLTDPHAEMALSRPLGAAPTSARFYLAPQKRYFEALIDFIMVSPDLAALKPDWRIWHPLNDPEVLKHPDLSAALLKASDHFPVTLDLQL